MVKIECTNCHTEIEINISNAIDEEGEVFCCPNCGKKFRYTDK